MQIIISIKFVFKILKNKNFILRKNLKNLTPEIVANFFLRIFRCFSGGLLKTIAF